jgi:glycosyltransferase involved in cell wall biosynthesis
MNNRLRIWHLLESYPPDYGGGAAVTTREVCRLLAERGHDVRVLCVENSDKPDFTVRTELDGAVRVDRVSLPYFKSKDPDGWQLSLRAWRRHQRRVDGFFRGLLADWKPDLVDYHTVRPFGEQVLMTMQTQGVPVVATLHEAWLICPRLMLLRSPVARECTGPAPIKCLNCLYSHYDGSQARAMLKLPWRIAKLGAYPAYRLWQRANARETVAGALARSNFMARVHKDFINGEVRHIALGIDLTGLPPRGIDRPRSPLKFGFVGGFQPNKGIEDVLASARSLKAAGLPFELNLWGPGTDDENARQAIQGLEDRVFLRGMYSVAARWNVYGQMDVALMATKVCEPLGRVPIEGAAAGVPTIAPAIGGITETIRNGIDGLLYRFRDAEGLQAQMKRALTEPGLVERLIDKLPPVQDTSLAVEAVEEFYFSVLAASPDRVDVAALLNPATAGYNR